MTTIPLPFPHASSAQVGPVVPLPAGVRIDRFVVEQTLHHGPHGFAYLVREAGHQQPLVLLECFPRTLAIRQPDGAVRARQAGDAISLSVVCEAFVQDARALAAIDHPGVVKVFGIINANRTVYRLMPFVDGRTLEEQRLERAEPPTVGGLVRLYDKLLDALEALHRAGFVHGLVQPDQIIMKADDNAPMLLGMDGVAIELGEVAMSPWAAPEQQHSLRFERINASADLYMLAATMCFAATGAAPPRAEERLAGADWDPAPLLAEVALGGGDSPAMRDNLIQALQASLALAAAARPQRADDVRHILHPDGGDGAFIASSGPVPLWVGAVPDRDSQWETLGGMSAPVPLRAEAEAVTQLVLDPAPEIPIEPTLAAPAAPVVARTAVRAPRPADLATTAVGRRASDTPSAPPLLPRWLLVSVGSVALTVAALAWWSQRATSADLKLPLPPGAVVPSPDAAAVPAPVRVPPRAAAPAPAPAAPPADAAPAPPPVAAPAPTATPPVSTAATGADTPVLPAAAPAAPTAPKAPDTAAAAAPAQADMSAAPTDAKPAAPPTAPPRTTPAPAQAGAKAAARPVTSAAAKPVPAKAPVKPAAKPATKAADRNASARTASPESLCGNRTQFSYLYCMQEACARAAMRNNAQCNALRRSGDIR